MTTMHTAQDRFIAAAVNSAMTTRPFVNEPSPEWQLNEGVGSAFFALTEDSFKLWKPTCGEDDCTCGQPAWDKALSKLLNEHSELLCDEIEALLRQRLTELLTGYVDEHPEALEYVAEVDQPVEAVAA